MLFYSNIMLNRYNKMFEMINKEILKRQCMQREGVREMQNNVLRSIRLV
jgi:hypothetical protein